MESRTITDEHEIECVDTRLQRPVSESDRGERYDDRSNRYRSYKHLQTRRLTTRC